MRKSKKLLLTSMTALALASVGVGTVGALNSVDAEEIPVSEYVDNMDQYLGSNWTNVVGFEYADVMNSHGDFANNGYYWKIPKVTVNENETKTVSTPTIPGYTPNYSTVTFINNPEYGYPTQEIYGRGDNGRNSILTYLKDGDTWAAHGLNSDGTRYLDSDSSTTDNGSTNNSSNTNNNSSSTNTGSDTNTNNTNDGENTTNNANNETNSNTTINQSAANNTATIKPTTGAPTISKNKTTVSLAQSSQVYKLVGNTFTTTGRTLAANTQWLATKEAQVGNDTYLNVGANEWVKVANNAYTITKHKGVCVVKNAVNVYGFNNGQFTMRNRTLAANTQWKYDKKITMNGQSYVKVSPNEWLKLDNTVSVIQ